jgi:diaminohydroxyphosphoribosylaminopyrimidine deaminase/5-amino-6-(5-phosphoribosylamino)uracil reductase
LSEQKHIEYTEHDRRFMRRALELAERGKFTTSPNPRVGCVIVKTAPENPEPIIIGEGFHLKKGAPHAEREALSSCQDNPSGSTLYVTLEPCCHFGSTPPCTDAILGAGIKRVVIATQDPYINVSGRGIDILRRNGLQVDVGLLEEQARYLNRFFFHRHQTCLPWITLKCASSLDGKLATTAGESKWITGPESRAHVHELRAEADTVLAGIGTILADDPSLTARPEKLSHDQFIPPMRAILDPLLKIPLQARVLQHHDTSKVWIFTSSQADPEKVQQLQNRGVSVRTVEGDQHSLNLRDVLSTLVDDGVLSVFLEGGPQIHTAFLEQNLVNELLIYIAPILIGGADAPTFYMGHGVATIQDSRRLERIERLTVGEDTLIRGILNWQLK